MLAEQRTTGLDTNYFALHTTRTLSSMRQSLNTPNWVSLFNAVLNVELCHGSFLSVADVSWMLLGFAIEGMRNGSFLSGELVWRRHKGLPRPSRRELRTTCVHLLPLVEMFCKWELLEDCSDLASLMHRFDSETELESNELGRSLLFMIRNDDIGFHALPQRLSLDSPVNPFEAVRERLAAAELAIRDLRPQVIGVASIHVHMHGGHLRNIGI